LTWKLSRSDAAGEELVNCNWGTFDLQLSHATEFSLCTKQGFEDYPPMSAQLSFIRRSGAVFGILLVAAVVMFGTTGSSAAEPLNALVPRLVEVPLALRAFPFDHDRVLMVPPGFKVSVLARIIAARFIMPLPTGEILVAQPDFGKILLVRSQGNGTVDVSNLIDGLRRPQGMALYSSENRLFLYVGESNQISRFLIAPGAASAGDQSVIVPNLPDSSSPELGGSYGHELKNIVIGPGQETIC